MAFAVAFLHVAAKVLKKAKTATIVRPKKKPGLVGWLESQAIRNSTKIILFKRVSKEFKTQEGTENETLWALGNTVIHPNWIPKQSECGEGKFHACSRPYFADEFRSAAKDRYVAIEISKKDLYPWPNPSYPHKIAFRKGKVLYECDRWGKKF